MAIFQGVLAANGHTDRNLPWFLGAELIIILVLQDLRLVILYGCLILDAEFREQECINIDIFLDAVRERRSQPMPCAGARS